MTQIPCNVSNFRVGRTAPIRYIVIHYDANNGATAKNNCLYFQRKAGLEASAHYFVDDNEVVQSVSDGDTAWHCGGLRYRHPDCRNANSIGVELCSRKDAEGNYYFTPETVQRAAAFVRELMAKYSIPVDRVIRHYDVTGKVCPAPFVHNAFAWDAFKKELEVRPMDLATAKKILKEKAGLSDATITFLSCYKYGEDLILKLAKAM